MSVSALGRASLPPGRSSVPQCSVHHFTVITIILVTTVVASSQPKDECQQNQVTFASQIHTIGFIDDALWAITKPDWNVYKLTPCNPVNDSLVHCMKVDLPVEVDAKWPKLAESVKSAAKEKDFTFTVDSSVVMDSSEFVHTVLAIHSGSFNVTNYFGFDFGGNKAVIAGSTVVEIYKDFWISSDVKDKGFRFFGSAQKVEKLWFKKDDDFQGNSSLRIIQKSAQMNICSKDDLQVKFQEPGCTGDSKMVWSVSKGVLYGNQFYLFGSTKVYIFSEQAETDYTRMQTVALADFFHCYTPSTMPHPTSPSATSYRFTANSSHMTTTVKGSHTTLIVIIVLVVVFLLICCCACCFCCVKASKTGKGVGNSKPSSSSMKISKVSSSKGPSNQAQSKANTTKVSPGKQSLSKVSPGASKDPKEKVAPRSEQQLMEEHFEKIYKELGLRPTKR